MIHRFFGFVAQRDAKSQRDQTGRSPFASLNRKPRSGMTLNSLPSHSIQGFRVRRSYRPWVTSGQDGVGLGGFSRQLALLIPSEFVGLGVKQIGQSGGKPSRRRWLT